MQARNSGQMCQIKVDSLPGLPTPEHQLGVCYHLDALNVCSMHGRSLCEDMHELHVMGGGVLHEGNVHLCMDTISPCTLHLLCFGLHVIHYKNTAWVSYFFRFSQFQQCNQGMLPNWFYLRSLRSFQASLVTVASLFSQKTYLATFLAFLPQTMQPRTQSRCVKSKKQKISPEMLIYKFQKAMLKEGSISTVCNLMQSNLIPLY